MVTGTPLTLPSGRMFRIQIPGAEREQVSDRKVLDAASMPLTVFFRDVLVKNVYKSVGWHTFAAPPVSRVRQEDHIFDINIGFREPRAGVKLSGEELA